jgi:hypothetical protein
MPFTFIASNKGKIGQPVVGSGRNSRIEGGVESTFASTRRKLSTPGPSVAAIYGGGAEGNAMEYIEGPQGQEHRDGAIRGSRQHEMGCERGASRSIQSIGVPKYSSIKKRHWK